MATPKKKHHESAAHIAARKRRDAIRAAQRRAARRRRDAIRAAQRELARERRRAIRKVLREQARLERDTLRRIAREIARQKRDAERRLLRAEARALLRRKYLTRMVLSANGTWVWTRVSGPSYNQASRAVAGQKAYYPSFARRNLRGSKAQKAWPSWS
jgi:predicted phage gp36 major capsid-like protein